MNVQSSNHQSWAFRRYDCVDGSSRTSAHCAGSSANNKNHRGGPRAPELALGNTDFESLAISPLRELGAYEAMWDNPGVTFKTISEQFAARPGALPSDFVTTKQAGEYADFVRERLSLAKAAQQIGRRA